ncbi:hypothetical protein [Chitinophaga arvensicola]|uniref:hypothetical protein n=1 Tax=Chitinophaga arvensicola TaxID=29529 RepID=UPI0015A62F46|nr:hypothetical protein [Chitinophaga arvensicola]
MKYRDDGSNKPYKARFKDHPNWKMVSKNRKQWMKKRFMKKIEFMNHGSIHILYGW